MTPPATPGPHPAGRCSTPAPSRGRPACRARRAGARAGSRARPDPIPTRRRLEPQGAGNDLHRPDRRVEASSRAVSVVVPSARAVSTPLASRRRRSPCRSSSQVIRASGMGVESAASATAVNPPSRPKRELDRRRRTVWGSPPACSAARCTSTATRRSCPKADRDDLRLSGRPAADDPGRAHRARRWYRSSANASRPGSRDSLCPAPAPAGYLTPRAPGRPWSSRARGRLGDFDLGRGHEAADAGGLDDGAPGGDPGHQPGGVHRRDLWLERLPADPPRRDRRAVFPQHAG